MNLQRASDAFPRLKIHQNCVCGPTHFWCI